MNIDERLEALTQTAELLAHSATKHDEVLARHERILAGQQTLMNDIMEAISRLANTAGAHQDRLDQHGQRLGRLEGQ